MKIFAKFKKLPAILAVCLLLISALGLAGCSNTKSGSTGGGTGTPTSYGSGMNGGGTGTYTSNGTGNTGSYGTGNTGSYTGGGAQNRYTNNNNGTSGANSLTTDLNDVGRDISNGVNSMKKNLSADM